jgi:hypothetical protein
VAGLALPELNAAANAAGNATRAVRGAAAATAATQDAADAAAVATKGPSLRDLVRAPSQLSGVGAAEHPGHQRAARAQALPVPIKLTKGQLTRDRTQVAFERETAKQKEGAPLAAHYEDQNATFGQNLDAYADQTGAEAYSRARSASRSCRRLEAKDAAKQAEIRNLYQTRRATPAKCRRRSTFRAGRLGREEQGEGQAGADHQHDRKRAEAERQGGRRRPDNLTLTPRPKRTVMTLDASEDLRQAINKLAEPGTPNVVFGKEAKALIDAAQEGKGGDLFKQARRAYENYSQRVHEPRRDRQGPAHEAGHEGPRRGL